MAVYYTIYHQQFEGDDYEWNPVTKLNGTIERTLANDVIALRESKWHDWKIVWANGNVVARKQRC